MIQPDLKNKDLIYSKVIDECESTNDLVRTLGEKHFAHGSWTSAHRQKSGRGRMGRDWVSQEGNLFLSILLRPTQPERVTWLPHAVGVGVLRVLKNNFSDLDFRLKWPNDVYIGRAKLGGILCEGFSGSKNNPKSFVVAGIGLNVGVAPKIPQAQTTALADQVGRALLVERLCDQLRLEIVESVMEVVWHLETEGFSLLKKEYERALLFQPGDTIQWRDQEDQNIVFRGEVEALGEKGELLVWTPAHGLKALFSEEVTFGLLGNSASPVG